MRGTSTEQEEVHRSQDLVQRQISQLQERTSDEPVGDATPRY